MQAYTGHYYHNDAFALPSGGTQPSCLYSTNVWKGQNILSYQVTCQHTMTTPVNWLFWGNTSAVMNSDSRFTHLIIKGNQYIELAFRETQYQCGGRRKTWYLRRPIWKWQCQIYLDQELRAGQAALVGPNRSCPTIICSRGSSPFPKKEESRTSGD